MGGSSERLPLEIVLRIAAHLRRNDQLGSLTRLIRTSRAIHDLLIPTLYTDLILTDDQLRQVASAPEGCTRYTRSLTIVSPLSSSTVSDLASPPHPSFPRLDILRLTSTVLKALPHDKPAMSSYDTSRSFRKRCAALTSHLGPYRQLEVIPSKGEECVFQILHPILPTSLGLSNFLPRLAALHPELEVVRYEKFHADLIYPTSRIRTEYKNVCGCWLKYGAERLGLGIRLAWAGEKERASSTIEISPRHSINDQVQGTAWDRFEDQVLEYLRDGREDLEGRIEIRARSIKGSTSTESVDRLRCLTITQEPT